jgi:hypothetical protein
VNTDVTSPDFLQPVDNSGSVDNSTKTTTTTTFVLAKYHSEAVPQTFTRIQHNIAFLVKQRRDRYPRFPSPEAGEGGSAIGE